MSDPFECCICLDTLENPKALHCGHSFCSTPKDCLRKVLTSDSRRCSKCRKPIAASIRNEDDISINYDLKTAIEASQQSSSNKENQASQDLCSVHKNAKKFYCKNCSVAVCEDCWNRSHLDHSVVPLKSVLKELITTSSDSWKFVEQYQNNYKSLVSSSVDLNEEIVSTIQRLEKLTELKNKTQNAQNVQIFHSLQEKSLEELNEQKKVVENIKSNISKLSNSCTAVENSLNKAIDTFSQSKTSGSSKKQSGSALTRKTATLGVKSWQLRDIRKGSATTGTFEIYRSQFYSQTQEVLAKSRNAISVLKVQGETITEDRKLPFQGVEALALSGSGSLYVHYRKDGVQKVSVVDKENGRVVRTLNTSKADNDYVWNIHAHGNVFLVVEWSGGQNKCVHVYENEIHKRTLQLLTQSKYLSLTVMCGRDYLLLETVDSKLAIVDLNQSGSKAKFNSIQLGQMTSISSIVWIANGNDQSGEGYLFATEVKDDAFNSHVYELNVKSAVDGTVVTPLQIPFINSYGSGNVTFRCAMGTNAVFCSDLCGKNVFEYKKFEYPVNILKLEKIINQ